VCGGILSRIRTVYVSVDENSVQGRVVRKKKKIEAEEKRKIKNT
jgi:hypothetical protein